MLFVNIQPDPETTITYNICYIIPHGRGIYCNQPGRGHGPLLNDAGRFQLETQYIHLLYHSCRHQ